MLQEIADGGGRKARENKRREVQGPKLESEKRVIDSEKERKTRQRRGGSVLLKLFLIRQ